jgi:hypothetical protein
MRTIVQLALSIILGGLVVVAADLSPRPVVITAKPTFEKYGDETYLLIADAAHHYEVSWAIPPKIQIGSISLDTNHVYTFTIAESPDGIITMAALRKVQQDGQTIFDIEVCEIHKVRMQHQEVPFRYGLIGPDPKEPSADIKRKLFPHHREILLGGCMIGPHSPTTGRIYVCSECQAAYETWKKESRETK